MELLIQPGKLTLADLRQAYLNPIKVKLDESASAAINASVACVEQIVNEGRTAYGINTGFGLLASTKIAPEDLELEKDIVFDPEFLICTSYNTHQAITFGNKNNLFKLPTERRKGDTKLW